MTVMMFFGSDYSMRLLVVIILGLVLMGCAEQTKVAEIKKTKVVTFRVEKICPKCRKGTMKITSGIALLTYPAQYPHKCSNCDYYMHYSGVQYPYIEYKD